MARLIIQVCASVILVLIYPHTTMFACSLETQHGPRRFGAGAHGGDRMQSDFLQGLRQAAHVVATIRPATLHRATDDPELRSWILNNKEELKTTLEMAQIEFNDEENQLFCALVRDDRPNFIQISRPKCHNIVSIPKAGELLIHEAVHLMGIASETFAPAVADVLYRAWEFAGHTLDARLHSTSSSDSIAGRTKHTGVWTGFNSIFWGGLTRNGETNSGGIYDHVLDVWRPTSRTNAPMQRIQHTAVWTGSRMIVWGGAHSHNLRSDRIGWYYNSGGIYDPASDSWSTTPQEGAPSERYRHTGIWTGREMVVWGGGRQKTPLLPSPNYEYLNSGGAYDPETNKWRTLSLENAPSARFDHTAVWAGDKIQKMIVWGGYTIDQDNRSKLANTGAMWDPTKNTWAPISTENAPSPRVRHAAVWTGSKLIIWGGYGLHENSYKLLNTGGIYDPQKDTWEPLNLVNAPTARDGHIGVWTGSHLLIFGGRNPVAMEPEERTSSKDDYTTIALYNPQTREWHTPLFGDVWMDRRNASGLWTGQELVTWGGDNFRKSGRVYYPQ